MEIDGNWTWINGNNTISLIGVYGSQGIPSSSNIPGARYYSTGWIDSFNNFWLFGGQGFDSNGNTVGILNDLWKFDGNNWTWIDGNNTILLPQFTQLNPLPSNIIQPRQSSTGWIDFFNNIWLFGGEGADTSIIIYTNDMWKFNVNCFGGTFSNNGIIPCISCEAGTYSNITSASKCLPCEAGTYSNITSASKCLPCEAGTYSNITSASRCLPCEIGNCSNLGSEICISCSNSGSEICISCSKEQYSEHNDQIIPIIIGVAVSASAIIIICTTFFLVRYNIFKQCKRRKTPNTFNTSEMNLVSSPKQIIIESNLIK